MSSTGTTNATSAIYVLPLARALTLVPDGQTSADPDFEAGSIERFTDSDDTFPKVMRIVHVDGVLHKLEVPEEETPNPEPQGTDQTDPPQA